MALLGRAVCDAPVSTPAAFFFNQIRFGVRLRLFFQSKHSECAMSLQIGLNPPVLSKFATLLVISNMTRAGIYSLKIIPTLLIPKSRYQN